MNEYGNEDVEVNVDSNVDDDKSVGDKRSKKKNIFRKQKHTLMHTCACIFVKQAPTRVFLI